MFSVDAWLVQQILTLKSLSIFFNGQISMLYPEKIGVDFQTSFVLLIVGVGRLPCSIAHRGGMDTSTWALWEDVGGITLIRLVFYGKKTSALCHFFVSLVSSEFMVQTGEFCKTSSIFQ
jgi:hypothetical protein